MFEVGKTYEIKLDDGEGILTMWGKIEKYEHPLIKLEDGDAHVEFVIGVRDLTKLYGEIINVTSTRFISATRKDTGEIEDLE